MEPIYQPGAAAAAAATALRRAQVQARLRTEVHKPQQHARARVGEPRARVARVDEQRGQPRLRVLADAGLRQRELRQPRDARAARVVPVHGEVQHGDARVGGPHAHLVDARLGCGLAHELERAPAQRARHARGGELAREPRERRVLQQALRVQQLGDEDARAGRAQHGVVREAHELVVEHGVLAHAAHADGVAVADVAVEARLRAVRLLEQRKRARRRGRAAQRLALARVRRERLLDRGEARLLAGELHGNARGVPVEHGHARRRRRDLERVRGERHERLRLRVERAEDLARLGLELVLLAVDERHDVVEDVHAADAGREPGAADRLQRREHDVRDGRQRLQRLQRDDDAGRRAVRDAHVDALAAVAVRQRVEVLGVRRRHAQRHVRVLPVVLRVRDHVQLRGHERGLDLAGNGAVEPAEHDVAAGEVRGRALAHDQPGHAVRDLRALLPARHARVRPPGAARARAERDKLKQGVVLQQQDEALPDAAGSAQHAGFQFLSHWREAAAARVI